MSTQIDILINVQDCDTRLARFNREIDDIPAREEEIAEGSAKQKQDLENAKEALKVKQAKMAELELEIDTHKQQITKLREQQLTLKTNKEFKAMDHEITGIEQKIAGIEDGELAVLEEIDEAKSVVKGCEDELGKAEGESKVELDDMKVRRGELDTEMSALKQERDAIAAEADDDWLRQYERIFANKGGDALVPTDSQCCGGCHMKLPPAVYHRARVHDVMVSCDFCGRLLY